MKAKAKRLDSTSERTKARSQVASNLERTEEHDRTTAQELEETSGCGRTTERLLPNDSEPKEEGEWKPMIIQIEGKQREKLKGRHYLKKKIIKTIEKIRINNNTELFRI